MRSVALEPSDRGHKGRGSRAVVIQWARGSWHLSRQTVGTRAVAVEPSGRQAVGMRAVAVEPSGRGHEGRGNRAVRPSGRQAVGMRAVAVEPSGRGHEGQRRDH